MKRPVLGFVHPNNAHVVYFFQEGHLFAVDLQMHKVTEFESNWGDHCGHVLAWELPTSLRVPLPDSSPRQESKSTFDFDSVADSFREAYGHALSDMEFHQLSRMALADLNRKKKPEVLVFAEFRSDAVADEDRDDWDLSSCKILTRNYHGGLYGEDASERRSKGGKKRKRSIHCFACAAEMLHPNTGFDGGYAGITM